jgi:hypothetical protein
MRSIGHTLLGWLLLVQSVALVADNGHLLKDLARPWEEVGQFATQDACVAEAERRNAEGTQRFEPYPDSRGGVVVTYRYRCVERE